MKYVSKIKLSNSSKLKRMIIVEPWAEVFELLPEQTLELIAQSENEGEFEIDFDGEHDGFEYITIYAWYGCTIEVLSEGENLSGAGHIAAFTISSGLSLSEFTKKIFGRTE